MLPSSLISTTTIIIIVAYCPIFPFASSKAPFALPSTWLAVPFACPFSSSALPDACPAASLALPCASAEPNPAASLAFCASS